MRFSEDSHISNLAVFQRLHLICEVLLMPVIVNSTSNRDVAALRALPDATRWVAVRADRGNARQPSKAEEGTPGEVEVPGASPGSFALLLRFLQQSRLVVLLTLLNEIVHVGSK